MIKINLIELCNMDDKEFLCAVIAARYQGKWIFVRGKEKETWELPGGTHESNESIIETAKRELYEETGAIEFNIVPMCISFVDTGSRRSYGMVYYSEICELGELPNYEIDEVKLFDNLPEKLTYPWIHNVLFQKAIEFHSHYF
jgi:8-oxo-dGTP diphosphatase